MKKENIGGLLEFNKNFGLVKRDLLGLCGKTEEEILEMAKKHVERNAKEYVKWKNK